MALPPRTAEDPRSSHKAECVCVGGGVEVPWVNTSFPLISYYHVDPVICHVKLLRRHIGNDIAEIELEMTGPKSDFEESGWKRYLGIQYYRLSSNSFQLVD